MSQGKTVKEYQVDVWHDDESRWWMVRYGEHLTQAEFMAQVELMAQELVALVEDEPLDEVRVRIGLHPLGWIPDD